MTKDEMIAAYREAREQGYNQAADKFRAEIDALTAQLAARDEVLRALVTDQTGSHSDREAGTRFEQYSGSLECFYCDWEHYTHDDDCPIVIARQLLASKETQHDAQSPS